MQILFKEGTTRVIMLKKKKAKVIQKKKIVVTKKLLSKKNVKNTIKKKPLLLKKKTLPTVKKKIQKPLALESSKIKTAKNKVQVLKKKIIKPIKVQKALVVKKTPVVLKKNEKKIVKEKKVVKNKTIENKIKPVLKKEISTDSVKSYITEQETSTFKGNILSKDFFDWKSIQESLRNLSFFYQKDSEECQEKNCDQVATTLGYCRFHYIKNIKKIKVKREILSQERLQKAMEMLFLSYPPDVIEYLLKCLNEEKNFYQLLRDFNIADMDYQEEAVVVDEDEDDLGFPRTFLKQGFEE